MLKPLAVCAALTCCALGNAQAVLLTKGSVVLVNFNAAPRNASTATQVFIGGVGAASSDAVMMDFYDGEDLTGALLGSYSNQDSGWKTLSGLLDGEFSVRFTVTSATASVGDAGGDLNTVWLRQDGPLFSVISTPAVDKSQSTPVSPPNDVPEPGSLLLTALAGLALTATRRRKTLAA